MAARFTIQPRDFSRRLEKSLAIPMQSRAALAAATRQIQILWRETVALTQGQYIPKFGLPDNLIS